MKNSTVSQSDSGSPETGGTPRLSVNACRQDLWLAAVKALGKIDIGPIASRFSQAWIAMGVERMQMTDRLRSGLFGQMNAYRQARSLIQPRLARKSYPILGRIL